MTPEEFKSFRKELKLSQKRMGEILGGYSSRAVASWESSKDSKRKIPPAVARLIEIMKVIWK